MQCTSSWTEAKGDDEIPGAKESHLNANHPVVRVVRSEKKVS